VTLVRLMAVETTKAAMMPVIRTTAAMTMKTMVMIKMMTRAIMMRKVTQDPKRVRNCLLLKRANGTEILN
jgi:hypothetical protein